MSRIFWNKKYLCLENENSPLLASEKPMRNILSKLYLKKYKNFQKYLAIPHFIIYNPKCCDMIAVKREVAALEWQVFRGANVKLGNWRQVTVRLEYLLRRL